MIHNMKPILEQSQKRTMLASHIYTGMKEITQEEYIQFLKTHDFVVIENIKVPLVKNHVITEYEPKDFKLETTTVWSFPERGEWATHKGNYRANWSPYIPRNLILTVF